MSSLLPGGSAVQEENCVLLRSSWTPSRRCGRYCPAKVRVPLRASHRQRGRRGRSRPEGLGAQHLTAPPGTPRTSQQPPAPLARSRQRFAQHPEATQAPLLGLVCHPVAKTAPVQSEPSHAAAQRREGGSMLGWSLRSISPWRTHRGSCRQQWDALSHPAGEACPGQRCSWQEREPPASVAGSQASPQNAQGSSPGAGRGEWPEGMSRAGLQQSLLHLS